MLKDSQNWRLSRNWSPVRPRTPHFKPTKKLKVYWPKKTMKGDKFGIGFRNSTTRLFLVNRRWPPSNRNLIVDVKKKSGKKRCYFKLTNRRKKAKTFCKNSANQLVIRRPDNWSKNRLHNRREECKPSILKLRWWPPKKILFELKLKTTRKWQLKWRKAIKIWLSH